MSNPKIQLLLQQMDYTFEQGGWVRALARATGGLTATEAAWSPGHGGNSIWQTVNHLAFWKGIVAGRLNGAPLSGGRISNLETFNGAGATGDEAAWQGALERLHMNHQAYREAVSRLTDEQLGQTLPGESTPLKELLMGLNVHDGYHLGQIVLLRKLQEAWQAR